MSDASPWKTWHWLGGWGCRPEAFAPFLERFYPGVEHRFYDVHARLGNDEPDFASDGPGHLVLAFSLGSLVAHGWRATGRWPEDLPLISLSPVFDFPSQGKGWPRGVLSSMTARIPTDASGMLADFWKRMVRGGSNRPDWQAAFLNPVFRPSSAELKSGLEFLWDRPVAAADAFAVSSAPWGLLFSAADPIAGCEAGDLPSGESVFRRAHPGGHLPFLQHPHALRELAAAMASPDGKSASG